MTIIEGLIDVSEYASYIEETVDASRVASWENAIEVASRMIETATGRTFYPATGVRYFDSSDEFVYLDDVRSVSEVAVDVNDDNTYTSVVTGYQLLPHGGRSASLGAVPYTSLQSLAGVSWPRYSYRSGVIRVTGTWGWDPIPAAVKRATCVLAQDLLRDKETKFRGLAVVDGAVLGQGLPDRVRDLVRPYMRFERVAGIA